MRSLKSDLPLVVILGPTAVGKTELSIQLAEKLNGEIISADSRLFYRGMDIGTAKPTHQDQARVPHHLIDVADPDHIWSLAMFQEEANRSISEIHKRKNVPFLVGGSGQYIRAVTEAWDLPAVAPDQRMRQVLQSWAEDIGHQGLHDRLYVLDPDSANRIDPGNLRRSIRALEVILISGKQFSTQKRRGTSRYRLLQLGLMRPRSELYARIDDRIEDMLEKGFVDEVRGLLNQGYSSSLPSLSAIGYRQIGDYLRGKIELDEAITLMKRLTRNFVRRQANWFKADDPNIQWFQAGPNVQKEMEVTIRLFLDFYKS